MFRKAQAQRGLMPSPALPPGWVTRRACRRPCVPSTSLGCPPQHHWCFLASQAAVRAPVHAFPAAQLRLPRPSHALPGPPPPLSRSRPRAGPLLSAAAPMEGRRTRGRAAAEKSGRGARAAGLEPSEPEADDGSPTEPWRRPVTDSVLRRIMTIRREWQFGGNPRRAACS